MQENSPSYNLTHSSDLCDGRVLLKLLEVLSGDKWAKPSRGTMRFHQLENNEKVFSYLKHAKVSYLKHAKVG